MAALMLAAIDLHVRLGGRPVLHGVSARLPRGAMTAIVGPNGSGKSTLVRALAGLLQPWSGRVEIEGRAIAALPRRALAKIRGVLSQSAETPGLTTVREHVGLGRFSHRRAFTGWSASDESAVAGALATCEVDHLGERRMDELSGGERQLVRLATLLAQDPALLLLDEPLTGLDIEHQLGLLHLLTRLHAEREKTIVCVLHDLDLALRHFPRVIVMHEGRVAADGSPGRVFCPRLFDAVFRVRGRIGREGAGTPVVVCDHPRCAAGPTLHPTPSRKESFMPSDRDSRIIEPKEPSAPPEESFAAMLKRGTQDLHDHAESGALQRRMVSGELLRGEFVAFLAQVRHVHAATEPLLRDAAAREPRLASMLRDEHFRLEKIDRDLADFGAAAEAERPAPLGAAERFISFVAACAERDPVALIGVLYVKEGATNGNKIVAMRLRQSLELPPSMALGYLDPHGADQRRRWNEFKAGLDAVPLSPADRLRCLDAARATFRLFIDLSEELAAGAQPDAAYTLRSS